MATAEIISIGTELLLGQILNTNCQFISTRLAELGINCYRHTTVGDNKERIKNCLRDALNNCDVVITTGGLGPTADDLTTECIAEVFAAPLIVDHAIEERLRIIFRSFGPTMPQSNLKQALRPEKAQCLPNPAGTAPGIIWMLGTEELSKAGISEPVRQRAILTFPGVPSEMMAMWKETASQFLGEKFGSGTIYSVELKHFGIGESAMAEKYADLLELSNPTVAPLAGQGECRLRVTAAASSFEEARAIAQPIVDQIIAGSGILCYGKDSDRLESVVAQLLWDRNFTVAVAESCTGGLVSKRLTDIPGSSKYMGLSVITYSNEAKQQLLSVPDVILQTQGAVSIETARAMANGVRDLAGADIGVGVTGVAGPDGGTAEKPVGLVFIALAANHFVADRKLQLPSTMLRSDIRYRAASEALNLIRRYLLEYSSMA
jgi:nicotinamide-nucleotide amidase